MVIRNISFLSLLALLWAAEPSASFCQSAEGDGEPSVSGNVGVLWQSYNEDSLIGAVVPPGKTGYNAFAAINYSQKDLIL